MMTARRLLVVLLSMAVLVGAVPLPAGASASSTWSPEGARRYDRPVAADAGRRSEGMARTDRVLVRWSTRLSAQEAGAGTRLRALGRASGRSPAFVRFSASGAAVYDLGARLGRDADAILKRLRATAGVASAEPDLWMTADVLPNDTLSAELWGLLGAADGSPYGIDARAAWGATTGAGVVVAVLDSGLVAHDDLAGQSVAGFDMISDVAIANDGDGRDADASDPGDWVAGVADSSWHGTHVAGTIAALAGNGLGVFGGSPGVKIQPVRVIGAGGGYTSDIADGVRWAAGGSVPGVPANATPARVLNLSLGGPSATCPPEFSSAIGVATALGALVVVAAGNEGIDTGDSTPANCPEVLTVAAIDEGGRRAPFSNSGVAVDLAAPGVGIWSTIDAGTTVPAGPTYAAYDGTSMATPHVTLSAALVAAAYPGLSRPAIEAVLDATVTPFAADATATGCAARGCGQGIVDVGAAFGALAGPYPLAGSVRASTDRVVPGGSFSLSAHVVDLDGVAAASYRFGDGTWQDLPAADGSFGGMDEALVAVITAPASLGTHTLCVLAVDVGGQMGLDRACTALTVAEPTPGDRFADAFAINGAAGSVAGTNVGATSEEGEPPTGTVDYQIPAGPDRTVWYAWTAPASGTLTLGLCTGTTFDSVLALYAGTSLGELARVTDADDTPGCGDGLQSRLVASVVGGTAYRIQVDGYGRASGPFTLTWDVPDVLPPTVTSFSPNAPAPETITYSLMFGEWVTGLSTSDFLISGDSSGWVVTSVACQIIPAFLCRENAGIGPYRVTLTGAATTSGTVMLSLRAFSVTDPAGNAGPVTAATAAAVTVTVPAPVPPTASITPLSGWRASNSIPLAWGGFGFSAPVANYDVRYRRASWKGSFGTAVLWRSATAATSATFTGALGSTYCFSVRARDNLGTVSPWTAQTCTAVPLDDRSLSRVGAWTSGTGGSFYRSTFVRSTRLGAKLVRTGVVARRIALVATTCPTCGTVRVYWSGSLLRTVKLTSATTVHRKVIHVTTFTRARTGTLTIRIVSSGRKVIIDGVAIRRN